MSAISSIQNNTIYFEQVVREQIKTQEIEARAELKDREVEMQGVQKNLESMKAQKTLSDKIVEELRPLCEELPPDAMDPVTLEPFVKPMVTRCGHTIERQSIVEIYRRSKRSRDDPLLDCPLCKRKISVKNIFYDHSFKEVISHLEKIRAVFKESLCGDQ